MIGLCTDSSAQLPRELVERHAIEVVPLTVTIDGVDHLEGVDLDADEFYAHFRDGHRPVLRTGAPSSGQFAAAYENLVQRGCTEILSIHLSAGLPATLNAARLAARAIDVPVKVLDSGMIGYSLGCAVTAAAVVVDAGGDLESAITAVERVRSDIASAFVVGSPAALRAPGCRAGMETDGVPVLTYRANEVLVVDRHADLFEAVTAIARAAVSYAPTVRIGVGHSCTGSAAVADALEAAVGEAASVVDVVRFRIGPSLGAHAGPGTAACVMLPAASMPVPPSPATS